MAELVVADGVLKGRHFALPPGTTRVGRAANNDIAIDAPSISGNHAEIVADGSGLILRDLNSTNGTHVNGARIGETRLYAGDRILLGDVPLVLAGPDAPARPPSAEEPVTATRPLVAVASAGEGQRAPIVPPDFKKRRDMRLIWVGVIGILLLLIAFAAWKFFHSVYGK